MTNIGVIVKNLITNPDPPRKSTFTSRARLPIRVVALFYSVVYDALKGYELKLVEMF